MKDAAITMRDIEAARAANPLYNAPPRICDLRGDDLREVLLARDEAARTAFLAPYKGQPKLGRIARLVAAVRRIGGAA